MALAIVILALCPAAGALAAEPGKITGTVTDAVTNEPIVGIEVCAYPSNIEAIGPESFACQSTGASGEYTLDLASGQYIVEFSAPASGQLNYVTQYYNGASTEVSARPVEVTAPATTKEINAKLSRGGTIGGTVTDAASGAPVGGITVCALRASTEIAECSVTSASGAYSIPRLAAGSYTVEFSPPFGSRPNYLTQYYSGQPSAFGATPVSVTAEATTAGIDAALQPGGQIAGTVTDVATGAAISGARVCAISLLPEVRECASTDEVGHYLISALPSADYEIRFSAKGYLTEYYQARYKLSEALVVPLFAGELKTGIDAAMSTAPATLPADAVTPSVSGAAQVGDTLSCAPGTWSAKPPPVFAYQWLRDGTAIEGATEGRYTPSKGDVGHMIACQVTATNAVGSGTAASAAVTIRPSPQELPLVEVLSRRLVAKGRTIRVKLDRMHARCAGRIAVGIAVRKGSHHLQTLAAAGFALAAGHERTIVLRVHGRTGAALLVRAKRHPLVVRLSVSVQAGGNQIAEAVRLV